MTISQKVKMALSYCGMNQSELARRLGTSPQNLSQKLKKNHMTYQELEQIAEILGASWKAEFEFPDGTKI